MKTHQRILTMLIVALCVAVHLGRANPADSQFPYPVEFQLGDAEFAPGDSITIESIHGTSSLIQTGQTYCVEGSYDLRSRPEAVLALFETVASSQPTPVDPNQTVRIKQGTGRFRLIKSVADEGYLHLTFYPVRSGSDFGGVYFGQGKWVLHNKHFTNLTGSPSVPVRHAARPTGASPNQALYEYLGNPVSPPVQIDSAYTPESLTNAVGLAARSAGVTLTGVGVDDSEFPFLLWIQCEEHNGVNRLVEQFKKMEHYGYGGSVGGDIRGVVNIVPWSAWPPDSTEQIRHRLMLRMQALFDRMQ